MEEKVIEVTAELVACPSPGSIHITVPTSAQIEPATAPPIVQRVGAPSGYADASPEEVNEAYGRESVRKLVQHHAEALEQLRLAVQHDALYHPERHDDLFLLRFLLSHHRKGGDGVAAAAKAVRATLAYRHKWGMDADDLPCGGPEGLKVPAVAKMWAILREPHAITYYCPDPRRGMLLIATPALLDFHRAVATMTDEEQGISHRMATEWMFRFCDRVTRRTGYLTKYVRIIDLSGVRLSHISRDFQRRDAQIAKLLEEHYPQLLGNVFLCHAPGFMHAVFAGLRQLMPRRVVEKVDFLQPRRSARDRSRLLEYVTIEHLPASLGGLCSTAVALQHNRRFSPGHLDI